MTLFAFFASVAFADNQAPTPPTATVERWHSDPLGCGLRVTGPQALVTRTEAARGGRAVHARVNGRGVSLRHQLSTGDRIENTTRPEQHPR